MIETVTTLVSLLLAAGATGVIGGAVWEDRRALRRALAGSGGWSSGALPPHTHRVASARRARFVTLPAPGTRLREAA